LWDRLWDGRLWDELWDGRLWDIKNDNMIIFTSCIRDKRLQIDALFGGGRTSEDQSHLPLILQNNDNQMMVDMK